MWYWNFSSQMIQGNEGYLFVHVDFFTKIDMVLSPALLPALPVFLGHMLTVESCLCSESSGYFGNISCHMFPSNFLSTQWKRDKDRNDRIRQLFSEPCSWSIAALTVFSSSVASAAPLGVNNVVLRQSAPDKVLRLEIAWVQMNQPRFIS